MAGGKSSFESSVWEALCLTEIPGRVTNVLNNGDLIIDAEVNIVHPKLNGPVTRLYGGVPKQDFEKGDRVAFRLRWVEREGKYPALVDPRTLRPAEDSEDFDIEKLQELSSGLRLLRARHAELSDELTKLNEELERTKEIGEEQKRRNDDQLAEVEAKIAVARQAALAEEQRVAALRADLEHQGLLRILDAMSVDDVGQTWQTSAIPIPDDPVEALHQRLSASGLLYPRVVVRRALVAHIVSAAIGQLVLFAGPPGSGKSSLASSMPRFLDGPSSVVPVRPGWLDATDILGYFDPRQGKFVPAPFLDLLLAASSEIDRGVLHSIVLDELNLARIENYGADLLSQFEKAHGLGDVGAISLYSASIDRERISRTLEESGGENTRVDPVPPSLAIPRNLVLSGTLNHDESTESLSPKVIDRSLVVRVPRHEPRPRERTSALGAPCFSLTVDQVDHVLDLSLGSLALSTEIWGDLLALVSEVDVPRVQLSERLARSVELVPGISDLLRISAEDLMEDLIVMKVLPWISFFKSQVPSALAELEQWRERASERGFGLLAAEIESLLSVDDDLVDYLQ